MSTWQFGCTLGLAQSGCTRYERDDDSRGEAQRFGGCASCIYRQAHNAETMRAEASFANVVSERERVAA